MARTRFAPDNRIAVTVRLAPGMHEMLRKQSYDTRESINDIIIRAITAQQKREKR